MRNLTLVRHCGLDPQSPERKDSSSRLGDGGCDSAMTAIVLSDVLSHFEIMFILILVLMRLKLDERIHRSALVGSSRPSGWRRRRHESR